MKPKTPLFRSFWQAGFECSTHKLKSGKRLDEVALTQHDRFAEQDFARLREIGILTAREGLRWHLIDQKSRHYDFSTVFPILEAAQRHGVEIIWDLLHFGWPDHLDIFTPEFLDSFTEFAAAFGKILAPTDSQTMFVAPVNEISFVSWAGGDVAYINPFAQGRGPDLKQQLVRAYLRAATELKRECPGIRLVSPEPVIHIVGDPNNPDDVRSAAEYRNSMFEAWDMISGRLHPELGGSESFLDIIGINYYDRNQWHNFGATITRHEAAYRPFREILCEVHDRYRRPMFIAETGTENEDRPHWLAYIAGQVRDAIRAGTPIEGICLYPILNHPGWDDDRHCRNGLWDYADQEGKREIYQSLAIELARQQHLQGQDNATTKFPDPQNSSATGPALSVAPAMEFCVSTAPTSDEPVRPASPGLLLGGAYL